MLSLPPTVRVFLCLVPVDMRRSFDGLAAAAQQVVRQDPLSGHLFGKRPVKGIFRFTGEWGILSPLRKEVRDGGWWWSWM